MCLHHQQNGLVEHKNRHLLEVARSLMLFASLFFYLCGDVLTVTYLINMMPSHVLHLQTPLECLKDSYPFGLYLSHFYVPLRVFGCIAYVHNHRPNSTKFIPRA